MSDTVTLKTNSPGGMTMRTDAGRKVMSLIMDIIDERDALRVRVGDLEAQVGESLSRTRLAMTALDLGDETEAHAILSALCGMLVDAGAVDPMEEL